MSNCLADIERKIADKYLDRMSEIEIIRVQKRIKTAISFCDCIVCKMKKEEIACMSYYFSSRKEVQYGNNHR